MLKKIFRLLKTRGQPNYYVFFVTARCNARCPMCFYMDNMEKSEGKAAELSLEEYEKISASIPFINILGISGGEPFLRRDLSDIIKIFYRNCHPLVLDLPTNGTMTENIARQVEDIVSHCPDMTVDIQLSIDGPPEVHNRIRGLPNGFAQIQETYTHLLALKPRYPNLKLKACVVYSTFNQETMPELFEILHRDFAQLDRIVFSVAHGSVWEQKSLENLNWARYFELCDYLERHTPIAITDFHSVFTFALRAIKNEVLKETLQRKDFYRFCQAGEKVVAVGETGQVFPCEPLWQSVGNLRENHYNLPAILHSEAMRQFQQRIIQDQCNCHWGLPMSNRLLSQPASYPRILWKMLQIIARGLTRSASKDMPHGA